MKPQLLNEKLGVDYKYSSVQINFPYDFASEVIQWGKKTIPEKALYVDPEDDSYGREDEIHLTQFFGLHEVQPIQTRRIIECVRPFVITLGSLSVFDTNNKYDVLKIDVKGKELHKLNKRLSRLPNGNKWPTYQPHATVCYVKKGTAKKLIGEPVFADRSFIVNVVVFSSSSGSKERIRLGQQWERRTNPRTPKSN